MMVFLYIFIIVEFVMLDFARPIKVTDITVIYNKHFREQIHEIFPPNLQQSSINSTVITTNTTEIDDDVCSLQNISMVDISKSEMVFLLTRHDHLFEYFLRSRTDQIILKYGTSISDMTENIASMSNKHCLLYTPALQKALTILTYSIAKPQIVVVTDSQKCSLDFFASLNESIMTSPYHEQLHVKVNHVTYHVNQSQYEPNIDTGNLYTVKSLDIRVIVLLVAEQYITMVFRESLRLGLLGRSYLWMISSYHSDVVSWDSVPMELLSFDTVEKTLGQESGTQEKYTKLNNSILDAINDYSTENLNRDELLMKIYQGIRASEQEKFADSLHLNIRYRHTGFKSFRDWHVVRGRIFRDWFYLHKNTIPVLQELTGKPIHSHLTAVTIFDEPYTSEQYDMYDAFFDSCTIGMKCFKPTFQNDSTNYEVTCCSGFIIDFFMLILDYLRVDVHLYIVEDGKYGAMDKDGKWTGMIADVLHGKADIAVAGLTITKSRSQVVNFTVPYLEAEMGIIVKPQQVRLNFINFKFLSPLSGELQLVLWFFIIVAMFLNYIYENNLLVLSLTGYTLIKKKYYSTFESMTYISGVALQRDLGGVNPVRPGAMVSAVIFAFGMVIVVSTYTAVLAAQSVQYNEKNPFKGSKDVRMRNPTPDFRFGGLKSSSYEMFFETSETDVMKRMHRFMAPYNTNTTEEGVKKVKNGQIEAFIGDYQFLYWYISNDKSCELKLQKDSLLQSGYGFAINKNFKWRSTIDQAILRYRDSPEIMGVYRKWFTNACAEKTTRATMAQLNINHFGGLVFILFLTAVLCFPALVPEYLFEKYVNNRCTNYIKRLFQRRNKSYRITIVTNDNNDDRETSHINVADE